MSWKLTPTKDPSFFLLIGPYDANFIQDLKHAVPAPYREWRPVAKAWRIADAYREEAQQAIDRHSGKTP